MFEQIPNSELTTGQVPAVDAHWGEIARFALTYHAYDHYSCTSAVGELANAAGTAYAADGTLPDTLTEPRTCLFFEQRRYHHFGWSPEGQDMAYIRRLIEESRRKVTALEMS